MKKFPRILPNIRAYFYFLKELHPQEKKFYLSNHLFSSILQLKVLNYFSTITYRCGDSTIDTASEICWSTDIKFEAHFWGLLKIKEFEASITFSDQKQVNSNRKELALTTSALIVDIFEPVQQLNTSD